MSLGDFKTRAEAVITTAFGGVHRVQGLKATPGGCMFVVNEDELSTFPEGGATRLVVACHDQCVSAQQVSYGRGRIKILLSPRERTHRPPTAGAHPTLEQHIANIRNGGDHSALVSQLRVY